VEDIRNGVRDGAATYLVPCAPVLHSTIPATLGSGNKAMTQRGADIDGTSLALGGIVL